MANKPDLASDYLTNPTSSQLIGAAYSHQGTDRKVLAEVIGEEHAFNPTAPNDAGTHKAGSAKAYFAKSDSPSFPTTRPDGITALSADDAGRFFVVQSNLNAELIKLYVWTGTAWIELFKANLITSYNGETPVRTVTSITEATDQRLQTTDSPRFTKVVGAFKGNLEGVADKIRSAAPASPTTGDIWIG